MKANEAPKKIYLYPSDRAGEEYEGEWGAIPWGEDCVEYTRTDAFIEKVLKFLDENFFFNNVHHSIESGVFESEEEMFDYFINYIKGE